MSVFITSDLHFMHQNIVQYTERHERWDATEEMTEGLIANWNSVVTPDDTVWVIGDVVMGKIAESLPLVSELNGHKFLCLGNHDRPHPCNKKAGEWFARYEEHFEWIGIHAEFEIGRTPVELCHFPYFGDSQEVDRHDSFRPEDNGRVLLHGHVHSEAWDFGERMIHVGIDADFSEFGVERYHPVPVEVIQQAIELKGY